MGWVDAGQGGHWPRREYPCAHEYYERTCGLSTLEVYLRCICKYVRQCVSGECYCDVGVGAREHISRHRTEVIFNACDAVHPDESARATTCHNCTHMQVRSNARSQFSFSWLFTFSLVWIYNGSLGLSLFFKQTLLHVTLPGNFDWNAADSWQV